MFPIPYTCRTAPPTGGAFYCDREVRGWVLNGSLVLGGSAPSSSSGSTAPAGLQVVSISGPVIVSGNVSVSPNVNLVFGAATPGNDTDAAISSGVLNVTGCLEIAGGELTIELPQGSNASEYIGISQLLAVSQGGCLRGTFDSVVVSYDSPCTELNATTQYSSTQLFVVFSFGRDKCATTREAAALSNFPIWGIAVAAVGGVLLLVALTIILIFNVPALSRRFLPSRGFNRGLGRGSHSRVSSI